MSDAPERIYLQVHPDETPGPDWDDERTWCQDSINDTDEEYVRADVHEKLKAENRQQKKLLRECRKVMKANSLFRNSLEHRDLIVRLKEATKR